MEAARAHLLANYRLRKREIENRLLQFEKTINGGGRALFEELCFCLLTPQSRAFSCNEAVRQLKNRGLLYRGTEKKICAMLAGKTRFHNKKAGYIVEARKMLGPRKFAALAFLTRNGTETEARNNLVDRVKGLGMKEASHYLRNVGRGKTIAILDRHVLKNLKKHKAMRKIPRSLTRKRYLEIEKKMERFCERTKIPLSHMDLLFWAEETGRVFK